MRIAAVFAAHADHDVFASFPGAGDVCAVQACDVLGRWPTLATVAVKANDAVSTDAARSSAIDR